MSFARSRLRLPSAGLPRSVSDRSFALVARAFLFSAAIFLCQLHAAPSVLAEARRAAITLPILGFKDDVDLVVAPNGRFVVVCEEAQAGAPAQVQIIELDAASGAPLGTRLIHVAIGFENGVDPIIVREPDADDGWAVLVPEEREDGSLAVLLVLRVADNGALLEEVSIDLGSLGFRPDVDGAWASYTGPLIAFFALESEDGSLRGVVAIDIDTRDSDGDFDPEFGSCTVVSNAAFAICDHSEFGDWLPGLVDAQDPVAYEVVGCCARFVVPVSDAVGSDLVLADFDPNFEPPLFLAHTSVKDLNSDGAMPLAFPGWVRDVDISLFQAGACGTPIPGNWILVPVASDAGGDLYLLDASGNALWVYSMVSSVPILGYEQGVDITRWCGLGGPHSNRLIVPVENAVTGDADVLIVDFETGEFLAQVENPALNPGITVYGFEVGVEPLLWTPVHALIPMEGAGDTGLLTIDPDARVLSAIVGPPLLGFARSVDPIVGPLTSPDRTLFVPVLDAVSGDAHVLRFPTPPDVSAPQILETINPGVTFSGFTPGVDLGLVNRSNPGAAYLMIPEEDAVTHDAQLRFEEVAPNLAIQNILVVPTPAVGLAPAELYFFKTSDGLLISSISILGLETGVDLANGRGPVIRADPPEFDVPAGFESDTDPTFAWDVDVVSVPDAGRAGDPRLWFTNPFRPRGRITWGQETSAFVRLDVLDVTGRRVRRLFEGIVPAGVQSISWDGRNASGREIGTGFYFVRLRVGERVRQRSLVYLK